MCFDKDIRYHYNYIICYMEASGPLYKLAHLKTSHGLKILNKYLLIEIFSLAF